jgi:hypothetical protein
MGEYIIDGRASGMMTEAWKDSGWKDGHTKVQADGLVDV